MNEEEAAHSIARDLIALGLRPGGALLVHSSLSSLDVTPENPLFDIRRTPSCVGATPEHFRLRPATRRSLHPTHSVSAAGARAAELLEGHHTDGTPCGAHSPYRRLRDAGGQVLFLGCGMRPNTSMHGVEELVEPPYLFGETVRYRLVRADGGECEMAFRRHSFRGCVQRYERIAPLLGDEALRTGSVLAAQAQLLEARAMWEAALRRDAFFFVDRVS